MDLFSAFARQIEQTAVRQVLIAFSGGLDSTALLSLFQKLREKCAHFNSNLTLRAIHIHHGLSANADHWVAHCLNICEQLKIPLIIERVQVDGHNGIEAAAREARYRAIRRHIRPNEVLATAHHLNDQTETFFLALKRGSGLRGLASMRCSNELLGMPIFRPLLNFSREQLEGYVRAEKLAWIHDESNDDERYDRNFLRHRILPELRERWRHFDESVARSAQHCFEQQQLIDELLQETFAQHCQTPTEFQLFDFARYSPAKQAALLRKWLAINGCEMPSKYRLAQLIQDVICAKEDANPAFRLNEKVLRRYQSCLYLTSDFLDLDGICLELNDSVLVLPDNLGELDLTCTTEKFIFRWQQYSIELPPTNLPIFVRFGYHGKVKRHPNRPRETIKKIWQELGVPPWQRTRIPLIFYGDELQSALGFFRVFKPARN